MIEKSSENRNWCRKIVIRLAFMMLFLVGMIFSLVNAHDVDKSGRAKISLASETRERCEQSDNEYEQCLERRIAKSTFPPTLFSPDVDEIDSLKNKKGDLYDKYYYCIEQSRYLDNVSMMFNMLTCLSAGLALIFLFSLMACFVEKRKERCESARKRSRKWLFVMCVFILGMLSMLVLYSLSLSYQGRAELSWLVQKDYEESIRAYELECSYRLARINKVSHRWDEASRVKENKRLGELKKYIDKDRDTVEEYHRYCVLERMRSRRYKNIAVVLFWVIVLPSYFVLAGVALGKHLRGVIASRIGLVQFGLWIERRFGCAQAMRNLAITIKERFLACREFTVRHKVVLILLLVITWLTVMVLYAVNKISAACRERDALSSYRQNDTGKASSISDDYQKTQCERTVQEDTVRGQAARDAAAREEAARSKAACDRIMLELQLQQQRENEQFNQLMMQQMMNQQSIDFSPPPSFSVTPKVSYKATCIIHNCKYDPALGCPQCKAPDFGNGRRVCCPKCGMSHNSQYNCPRCGSW